MLLKRGTWSGERGTGNGKRGAGNDHEKQNETLKQNPSLEPWPYQ